jgi:hypothetical protein
MVEHGQGPRSGARDNGLRCAGYLAIGDLDPRVADALLEALRSEGIAAYVAPTPGARGGYLEVRLPSQMTDRLYADSEHANRAGELLAAAPAVEESAASAELQEPQALQPGGADDPHDPSDPVTASQKGDSEIDFESAWQQLLGSLQSDASTPSPQWPTGEGGNQAQVPVTLPTNMAVGGDPALDEHFIPPPPPPLPRLRRVTVLSLLSIFAGLLVLGTNFDGGDLVWLAVLAILGGGGALIYHVKEGPPTDSGWDDGAVV